MPRLKIRKPSEVRSPGGTSGTGRTQQSEYESFIRDVKGNVGELQLGPEENIRGVKTRLRRAANRLGTEIEIWDADGKVYFRNRIPRRQRLRPRLYQGVILSRDLPEYGLKKGTQGVVMDLLKRNGVAVEFFDEADRTIEVAFIPESFVNPAGSRSRAPR